MIKFEDITFGYTRYRGEIKFITVPMPEQHSRSDLKERKRVDRKFITRTRVAPCVFEYSGKLDDSRNTDFKFYLVTKEVRDKSLRHAFATKNEAFRAIDMLLIREGKQPKYILKKND